MTQSTVEKDALTARISRIVENLMENESWFREKLNLEEMVNYVSGLIEEYLSPEELQEIDDEDISGRIRKVLTLEAVSGMLDDFTPEQMEIFDAAVEGRKELSAGSECSLGDSQEKSNGKAEASRPIRKIPDSIYKWHNLL